MTGNFVVGADFSVGWATLPRPRYLLSIGLLLLPLVAHFPQWCLLDLFAMGSRELMA